MGIGYVSFYAEKSTLAQCWYRIVDRHLGSGLEFQRISWRQANLTSGKKDERWDLIIPAGKWVGDAGSCSRFMIDDILKALRICVLMDLSSTVIRVMY